MIARSWMQSTIDDVKSRTCLSRAICHFWQTIEHHKKWILRIVMMREALSGRELEVLLEGMEGRYKEIHGTFSSSLSKTDKDKLRAGNRAAPDI